MTIPSVPDQAGEPVTYVNQADLDLIANYGSSGACVLYSRPVGNATIPLFSRSTAPTTESAPVAVRVCPISDIECSSARECESTDGKCRKIAAPPANAPVASVLTDAVRLTISTIARQLDLIAERAPGVYLDKMPVVRSLTAHKNRLEKALLAASMAGDLT